MNRAVLSVALASLLWSCTVDVPEPADGLFACEKDDDCSGDWACDTRVRRCIDPNNPPGNPCDTQPCNPGERCVRDDKMADGYFCSACGNDRLDGDEECDGPEPAGQSCATLGFGIGSIGCDPETCSWDRANCWEPPSDWCGPGTDGSPAEVASNGGASNSDIAIDDQGRPIVVYTQLNSGAKLVVRVSRFEGSERYFEDLNSGDPLSDPNGNAQRPRVAVAPAGRIGVVYRQGIAANSEIHFRQFNGDGWGSVVTLETCNLVDNCVRPDLAYIPANNTFTVVWMTGQQLRAMEVNAENAVSGLPSPSGGDTYGHDQPAIASWDDGEALVAWQADSGTNTAIYIKRWDSGAGDWVPVGWASDGGITNWGDHRWPSIARDGPGPLAVAWQRPVDASNTEGALRVWNGNIWGGLGTDDVAVAGRPYIGFLNVAMAGAEPAVVWQDGDSAASLAGNVLASFWRDGTWRQVPEPTASPGAIDIDDWSEGAGQTQVATGPNGVDGHQMCVTWSQKASVNDAGFFNVMVRCRLFP